MSLIMKAMYAERILNFMGVDTNKVKEILSDFGNKLAEHEQSGASFGEAFGEAFDETADEFSTASANGELSKDGSVAGAAAGAVAGAEAVQENSGVDTTGMDANQAAVAKALHKNGGAFEHSEEYVEQMDAGSEANAAPQKESVKDISASRIEQMQAENLPVSEDAAQYVEESKTESATPETSSASEAQPTEEVEDYTPSESLETTATNATQQAIEKAEAAGVYMPEEPENIVAPVAEEVIGMETP